jgi:hypothetical protein
LITIPGRGVDCSIGEISTPPGDLDDLGGPPDFRRSAPRRPSWPILLVVRSLAEAWTARSAKMSTPPAISTSSETHPIAEISKLFHSSKNTFGHSGRRSGQALGGTWLAGAEHGQQDHAKHG